MHAGEEGILQAQHGVCVSPHAWGKTHLITTHAPCMHPDTESILHALRGRCEDCARLQKAHVIVRFQPVEVMHDGFQLPTNAEACMPETAAWDFFVVACGGV